MAQNPRNPSRRVVTFSATARRSQFAIYDSTAAQWGDEQAEAYTEFLLNTMQMLADTPAMAPRVPNDPTARVFVARWKNARYGHHIYFDETPTGILVLRILHTAQDRPSDLRDN